MALSYAETERLFEQGHYQRLIELTHPTRSSLSALEPNHRLLIAHAMCFAGDLELANIVAREIVSRSNGPITGYAALVLGLIAWRRNDATKSVEHLRLALRIAEESSDLVSAAWARLHLLRVGMEEWPTEVTLSQLPAVRKAVTRAGNVQTSAYLHCCVSALEGQLGHLNEALRHCEIAESLLLQSPNSWIEASALMKRANIATFQCDFAEARRAIARLAESIQATGYLHWKLVSDATLGFLELVCGNLEQAEALLSEPCANQQAAQFVRISARDSLARVHLAQDRADLCADDLSTIWGSDPLPLDGPLTYGKRWSGLTRAKLLVRQGSMKSALKWLRALRSKTSEGADERLQLAINMLESLVLARMGASVQTGRLLFRSRAIIGDPEWHPQYYFACAETVKAADTELYEQLRYRALRLWNRQGVVSALIELGGVGLTPTAARDELNDATTATTPYPTKTSSVVNSIAAALDLVQYPRLCGLELLSLIRGLDCTPRARLVTTVDTESPCGDGEVAIMLGKEANNNTLTLNCAVPDDPSRAIVLSDVARIAAVGVELERLRRVDRSRAALWPADPVEDRAGALFVAEEMQGLLSIVRRVASNNIPVLITGETGTGKEVLAHTVHGYSDRASKPFIAFNCSATPRDMFDAQLFGHRKGAFTGATDSFLGIIRAASGGTLFLDEIGETPLELQPKLLRFLESSEVHAIGDAHPTKVDVRVIAATNADIESLVAEGRFREDLYYRLNIIRLPVPPLRARREEIPVLAQHFLDRYSQEFGKQGLRLAEETVEYLVLYKWPGNVRQLANEIRRMVALSDSGAVLMPEHLSAAIAASRRTVPASERPMDPTEVVVRLDQPMAPAVAHLERALILHALKKTGGRMEETASVLGLSRKGLYLKRQRLGLDPGGEAAVV